ncbi:hypothetical protein LXA43DRAFT_895972, partial [Ganoderma leucocontextum]
MTFVCVALLFSQISGLRLSSKSARPLTEEERDNICAFRLRFLGNVPRKIYDDFRRSFRHRLHLGSDWVILHRVASLSGVRPVWYECCINSCICYLGAYAQAHACPDCKEPRHSPAGLPRRYFCYIPLIPRLQAFFRSLRLIELMLYRARFVDDGDTILDVFSSEHYKRLCHTRVIVDGEELPHTHFSDDRDIALALCLDAYLLF